MVEPISKDLQSRPGLWWTSSRAGCFWVTNTSRLTYYKCCT